MRRVEEYVPKIEDGIPIPEPAPTVYTRKIAAGELIRTAEQIEPGQSVVLPVGSIGKFRKIVKGRDLETVCRVGQSDTEARVWVVGRTGARSTARLG
jgi:hypothetical protein